jgi:hypothetical protein
MLRRSVYAVSADDIRSMRRFRHHNLSSRSTYNATSLEKNARKQRSIVFILIHPVTDLRGKYLAIVRSRSIICRSDTPKLRLDVEY